MGKGFEEDGAFHGDGRKGEASMMGWGNQISVKGKWMRNIVFRGEVMATSWSSVPIVALVEVKAKGFELGGGW